MQNAQLRRAADAAKADVARRVRLRGESAVEQASAPGVSREASKRSLELVTAESGDIVPVAIDRRTSHGGDITRFLVSHAVGQARGLRYWMSSPCIDAL
eukprot:4800040-Pyramimonas_sp.AAC.1